MSDSTSDSPKPSDRFDNSVTEIRNRELEAGFTVSSVVYKAAGSGEERVCCRCCNTGARDARVAWGPAREGD